jgi:hypothetical protein
MIAVLALSLARPASRAASSPPNFGSNVYVFNPSMPVSEIQVIGLGLPTLIPNNGVVSMTTSAKGLLISGIIFDAGPANSPVLLQVGGSGNASDNDTSDPSVSGRLFSYRRGRAGQRRHGSHVNSSNVILDNIWAWRADHGNGVG